MKKALLPIQIGSSAYILFNLTVICLYSPITSD